MARIRSLKPEFWESEKVGRLDALTALTFVGLISLADDEGRGRGNIPYLLGRLHPLRGVLPEELGKALRLLSAVNLAQFYEVDGASYYALPGWKENQYIEKPSKSKFPPPNEIKRFPDYSPPPPLPVGEASPLDQGSGIREGKGRDQGKESGGQVGRPTNPLPVPSELQGLELYRTDSKLLNAWPRMLPAWKTACPGVDVVAQIVKAHTWELANPKHRKRDRLRFLTNWMNRAQDDASKRAPLRANPGSEAALHQGNSKPCGRCEGKGMLACKVENRFTGKEDDAMSTCDVCKGRGKVPA